jgi:hypothetical protein
MYDDVLNESVPDEFMSFLEEADERTDTDIQKKSPEGTGAIGAAAAVGVRAMKTEP